MRNTLQLIAGILLLLHAASHIGFLFLPDNEGALANVVFPVLSNSRLYAVAAIVEAILGLYCLRSNDSQLPSIWILTFVAGMLWYHACNSLFGGISCNCLGLLGRLLGLDKEVANKLPYVSLGVLLATTAPFLLQCARKLLTRPAIALFAIILLTRISKAENNIHFEGTITSTTCNPTSGKIYDSASTASSYTADVAATTSRITLRNHQWGDWAIDYTYNGVDNIYISPSTLPTLNLTSKTSNLKERGSDMEACIDSGPIALTNMSDVFGFSLLNIVYSLGAGETSNNPTIRSLAIPLPWAHPRTNTNAYGYQWTIQYKSSSRFPESCDVIRDKRLDLSEKEELARPTLIPWDSVSTRNRYIRALTTRKAQRTGFVKSTFIVSGWRQLGETAVPTHGRLLIYLSSLPIYKYPWRVIEFDTTGIRRDPATPLSFPPVDKRTHVTDFRYRKATSTAVYTGASYYLDPGQTIKAVNDVELVKASNLALSQLASPKLIRLGHWVAWGVLGVIFTPAIVLSSIKHQKRGENSKNTTKA